MSGGFVGNFTSEELAPDEGYPLVVGVGHAGDYNGYTVSYREFVSRDHYRKALTCCGPHTADYMVTRLLAMTRELRGGDAYAGELHDPALEADEARAVAASTALGAAAAGDYDTWQASLPDDVGEAEVLQQPDDIERFASAEVRWRGGTNAVDNPIARVERLVDGDMAVPFADASGEVPTGIVWPQGVQGLADAHTGSPRVGVVRELRGVHRRPGCVAGLDPDRHLPLRHRWPPPRGRRDRAVLAGVGAVPGRALVGDRGRRPRSWTAPPSRSTVAGPPDEVDGVLRPPTRYARRSLVTYPRTDDEPAFDVIGDDGRTDVCKTCSFRPWAFSGLVDGVTVEVVHADGAVETLRARSRREPQVFVAQVPGGLDDVVEVRVPVGGVRDVDGNLNGSSVSLPMG